MIKPTWDELTSELSWMITDLIHTIKELRNNLNVANDSGEFKAIEYSALADRLSDVKYYAVEMKKAINKEFEEDEVNE